MQIDGIMALVTGGGSGLGEATARHLAGLGAQVAVLDFNTQAAEAVARDIGGLAVSTDVSDEASVAAAVDRAMAHFGTAPRLAVNCAGIAPAARVAGRDGALGTEVFTRTLAVNLTGSYRVMAHAVRAMQGLQPTETGERGLIVNTASIAYLDGQVGQTAYAASKGGIAAMTLPAARELASAQIRVMAIAPGLFNTPMMQALPADVTDKIIENVPFPHRLGLPEEYARLVQHIAENPYLNGEVIRLDGAVRLPRK